MSAQPLTQEQIDELEREFPLADRVVYVGGKPYDSEDLHECTVCGHRSPYGSDFTAGRCFECVEVGEDDDLEALLDIGHPLSDDGGDGWD